MRYPTKHWTIIPCIPYAVIPTGQMASIVTNPIPGQTCHHWAKMGLYSKVYSNR